MAKNLSNKKQLKPLFINDHHFYEAVYVSHILSGPWNLEIDQLKFETEHFCFSLDVFKIAQVAIHKDITAQFNSNVLFSGDFNTWNYYIFSSIMTQNVGCRLVSLRFIAHQFHLFPKHIRLMHICVNSELSLLCPLNGRTDPHSSTNSNGKLGFIGLRRKLNNGTERGNVELCQVVADGGTVLVQKYFVVSNTSPLLTGLRSARNKIMSK